MCRNHHYFNLNSWCILDYWDIELSRIEFKNNKKMLYDYINDCIRKVKQDPKYTGKHQCIRVLNLQNHKIQWCADNKDYKGAMKEINTFKEELNTFKSHWKSSSDELEFAHFTATCNLWTSKIMLKSKNQKKRRRRK